MVFFLSPYKKKEDDPLDDFTLKKDAVKGFGDAMQRHHCALRDLESAMRTCIRTMEAVAVSLHNLATDAQVTPVAVNVSGALCRGLASITSDEGGTQWEDLQEEIDFSLKERFTGVIQAHKDLDACRKRRSKAKKELDSLQAECDKLGRRCGNSPPPQPVAEDQTSPTRTTGTGTVYEEALRRKEAQELEFRRLHCEFEDDYAAFMAKLGAAVQEDVRGISQVLYGLLAAVSYQFRKCEENVTPRATAVEGPVRRREEAEQSL